VIPLKEREQSATKEDADDNGYLLVPPDWREASRLVPSKLPLLDSFTYQAELKAMLTTLEESMASAVSKKTAEPPMYLIEFACREDSEIGNQGPSLNTVVFRCSEKGNNIMTAAGMARAFEFAKLHTGCHLWGSIPCKSWSSLQNLNLHMYGAPFAARLAVQQRESLRMLKNFIALAKLIRENGGHVCFEWPAGAAGWKEKLVQKMIQELEMTRTFTEGCMLGLVSKRTGERINKPWIIATTSPCIADAFGKRLCSKDHPHTPCMGGEASASGKLPT
jgi:hypothetical protein